MLRFDTPALDAQRRVRAVARAAEILWVVCVVGAVLAFVYSAAAFVRATDDQILRVMPDDAFYYLQIARRLANGGSSSADGLANTNGYHPLWMLLMTALAFLSADPEFLMRAAITTSFAVHLVASVSVALGLTPVIGRRWAMTAAACWMINPLAFLLAQQAVESTVYAAALMLVFGLYVTIHRSDSHRLSTRDVLRFGLALGVLCLARTEGVVVVALFSSALVIRSIRGGHLRDLLSQLTLMTAVWVGVLAPWLWFSWSQVGTIVQDSGAMKALWAADVQATFADRARNLVYMGAFLVGRPVALMTRGPISTMVLTGALLIGALALLQINIVERRSETARASRAVLAAMAATWLVYGVALSEHQVWWLTLPCLAIVVSLFLAVAAATKAWRIRECSERWSQTALLALSLTVFLIQPRANTDLYPWQPDVMASQQAIDMMVPTTERIGCFNAGVPLFFGAGRVIALDGLVNHRASMLWHEHRFEEFLRESNIVFIADEQRALNRAMRFVTVRPVLTEVTSYPLTGWSTGDRKLWRVSWSPAPERRADHVRK